MMKHQMFFGLACVLALGFVWLFYSQSLNGKDVVIVDSRRVLEEYEGFKEAKDSYELKVRSLTDTFNEKRKIYESKTKEYEILEPTLNKEEKSKRQSNLAKMQQELLKTGTEIENQSKMEEDKLLEGVYNKINDFVNRYGERKGYSVVLGVNGQGSVLYAKDKIDVTEELIEALNKEYVQGVY